MHGKSCKEGPGEESAGQEGGKEGTGEEGAGQEGRGEEVAGQEDSEEGSGQEVRSHGCFTELIARSFLLGLRAPAA